MPSFNLLSFATVGSQEIKKQKDGGGRMGDERGERREGGGRKDERGGRTGVKREERGGKKEDRGARRGKGIRREEAITSYIHEKKR